MIVNRNEYVTLRERVYMGLELTGTTSTRDAIDIVVIVVPKEDRLHQEL